MSDYAESKMADVQFTYELQRRLLHAGIDKYPVGGSASRMRLLPFLPQKISALPTLYSDGGKRAWRRNVRTRRVNDLERRPGSHPVSHSRDSANMPWTLSENLLDAEFDKELCERVCKKQACAIQFCLQRRNYQESKCAEVIKRYYDCCAAAKEAEQKTRTTSS
ncbi:Mature-T-Cell Proliferation I type [Phytophthora cactorum]|nr:Mature-T-Cell Proliferation I type [Phytophthora cactorum]